MWDRISIPAGIEMSLKSIFGAILISGIDRTNEDNAELIAEKVRVAKGCRPRFLAEFQYNIFYNDYAILYEIIQTLQAKEFNADQLNTIINTNRDLILNSPYIDKTKYGITGNGNLVIDDDIIEVVRASLSEKLDKLSNMYVTEDEFISSCKIYSDWYKNTLAEYTALNMSAIMSDAGADIKKPGKRSKHYHGLHDMQEFYNENISIIRSLSEDNKINSYVIDDKWLNKDMEDEDRDDKKAMFKVGIKEIDDTIGNLRRGYMLGIVGPPKGGKTRFTNYLVQRALSLGYNVCVWPLEGSSDEWIAMQIACLLASSSYESAMRKGKDTGIIRISSKDILEKKYKNSPEIRKQVIGAKHVMANSEGYGRLSFIEGTAYVEDFLDVIDNHYQTKNPFDVLVIDQLVNIMSKTGRGKAERISEAYMQTKNYLANQMKVPALGLMPAQLKQDVVDYLRKNPGETIDVTSGGESAETIRTPDEVIGLFSSKEERSNNIMGMYSVASRHNESFRDFQAKCYLECCMFMSQDK